MNKQLITNKAYRGKVLVKILPEVLIQQRLYYNLKFIETIPRPDLEDKLV